MLKNVASQSVGAQLVSATDGSAFTGSVTVAVTVDAGTQATGTVGSGSCTHEGGGYHTYAPAQAETNGDLIAFTFSGAGAVPVTVQVYTRAETPTVVLHGDYDAAKTAASQASVDAVATTLGTPVDLEEAGASLADNAVTVYNRINLVKNVTDTLEDVPDDIASLPVDTADAVLTRDWTQIVGSIPSRCALNALRVLRNAWAIASGSWTVMEEDDETPAFSKPVTGTPGADPVTSVGSDE